jgi:DNA-binding transcriptional MerR regulator
MEKTLSPIPVKRYFTIGEVGELCGVKPHVLRYWEQEFTQLRPMKRRGNRRYYQHHEVLMIRRIRDLLYEQGFTISGARNKLQELAQSERERRRSVMESTSEPAVAEAVEAFDADEQEEISVAGVEATDIDREVWEAAAHEPLAVPGAGLAAGGGASAMPGDGPVQWQKLRRELFEIRELLVIGD